MKRTGRYGASNWIITSKDPTTHGSVRNLKFTPPTNSLTEGRWSLRACPSMDGSERADSDNGREHLGMGNNKEPVDWKSPENGSSIDRINSLSHPLVLHAILQIMDFHCRLLISWTLISAIASLDNSISYPTALINRIGSANSVWPMHWNDYWTESVIAGDCGKEPALMRYKEKYLSQSCIFTL